MLRDLWVVYQRIVLPDDLTGHLPSVTRDWKNFAATPEWERRLRDRPDEGRQQLWSSFVKAIRREERPVLHYLHILLPHHPFTHLPDGQRYAYDDLPLGLTPTGASVWARDDWLVTQGAAVDVRAWSQRGGGVHR